LEGKKNLGGSLSLFGSTCRNGWVEENAHFLAKVEKKNPDFPAKVGENDFLVQDEKS
jgi:hypothetical protein